MIKFLPKLAVLKVKTFISYQRIAPFETMLGFFLAYAGIFGLIYALSGKAVASITTIGYKTTVALNIGYLIAGLGVFFGIGLNRYNIEAFGLITVAASLTIRAILTGYIIGITSPLIINLVILNGVFIFSCAIRLINIIKLHKASEVTIIAK